MSSNLTNITDDSCYGDNPASSCVVLLTVNICVCCVIIIFNSIVLFTSLHLIKHYIPLPHSINHVGEFYLICNLSASDLLYGVTGLTVTVWQHVSPVTSLSTCRLQWVMGQVPYTASLYSILSIALDRLVFILYGLRYPVLLSTARIKLIILAVWLISFTHAITVLAPSSYPSSSGREYQGICVETAAFSDSYFGFCFTICILPMVSVVSIYPVIVAVAVRARKRKDCLIMEMNNSSLDGEESEIRKPVSVELFRTISYLWKIRGVRTLSLLILAVLSCLLLWPMEDLYALVSKDETIIDDFFAVSSFLAYANSMLNPLLYAFGHNVFKNQMRSLMQSRRMLELTPEENRKSSVNNRNTLNTRNVLIIKY